MSIRIHPRMGITDRARLRVAAAIEKITQEHELTDAEAIQVISRASTECISDRTRYMIRLERHGDPAKPGDAA